MGCGCGSKTNAVNTVVTYNQPTGVKIISSKECTITKNDILKWQNVLKCIKTEGKFIQADITEFNVNQLLGIIQSALNYPENYCMYKAQLDYFKDSILVKIVMNVPECIN